MDSKNKFKELMKERHLIRKFQKKRNTRKHFKIIISISLLLTSLANIQP